MFLSAYSDSYAGSDTDYQFFQLSNDFKTEEFQYESTININLPLFSHFNLEFELTKTKDLFFVNPVISGEFPSYFYENVSESDLETEVKFELDLASINIHDFALYASTIINVNSNQIQDFYEGIQFGIVNNSFFKSLSFDAALEYHKDEKPAFSLELNQSLNDYLEVTSEYSRQGDENKIDSEIILKVNHALDSYIYFIHSYELQERDNSLNISLVHFF